MKIKLDDLQIDHIIVKELQELYSNYVLREEEKELIEAIEVILQYYMLEADALRFILKVKMNQSSISISGDAADL